MVSEVIEGLCVSVISQNPDMKKKTLFRPKLFLFIEQVRP